MLAALQAFAQEPHFQAGAIEVDEVRASPTPPVSSVGAVYLRIVNHSPKTDSLASLDSPMATKIELHRSKLQQGVMQMREIAALDCPPGPTEAAPGALHIMLLGLRQPLVAGSSFPLTLHFRDAGTLVVQVAVQ